MSRGEDYYDDGGPYRAPSRSESFNRRAWDDDSDRNNFDSSYATRNNVSRSTSFAGDAYESDFSRVPSLRDDDLSSRSRGDDNDSWSHSRDQSQARAGVRFADDVPSGGHGPGGGGGGVECVGCSVANDRLRTLAEAVQQLSVALADARRDVRDNCAAAHASSSSSAAVRGDDGPTLSAAALASAAEADRNSGTNTNTNTGPYRKYSVVSPTDAAGAGGGGGGVDPKVEPHRRRRSQSAASSSGKGDGTVRPVGSNLGATPSTLGEDPEEEPLTTCNRRWLIHPSGSFRRNWDTAIALCLVYNAISLPFRVCFDVPPTGGFKYFEWCIDSLVGTDILFNFRTAYFDEEGVLVTNPRKCALRYLRTWFLLDFLATFPYDVIIISLIEGDSTDSVDRASVFRLPRLIRLARLIRLVRLLRLFRLTRIFQKYQDSLDKYHGLMTTFKLAAVTVMASHFYACFWFLLTSLESFAEDTWGGAYGISRTNLSNQYLSSMHFAIQSITTVGYGDITPQNDGERLFVVLALLVGITVFGYAIGSIIALIVAHDQRRSRFLDKMRSINSWIEYRDIPDATASRIRAYFRQAHQTTNVQVEEQIILRELSNTLRTEVSMLLNENILRGVPFMSNASTTAITAIIMKLRPKTVRAGCNIITAGEVGTDMYVLVKGSAQVVSPDGNIIFATLEEGSFFGEIALIHAIPRTATVRAVTRCELLCLRKADFTPLLEEFEELKIAFTEEARKRMAANKKQEDDAPSPASPDNNRLPPPGASLQMVPMMGRPSDDTDNSPRDIAPLAISRSISFNRLHATESVWSEDDNNW